MFFVCKVHDIDSNFRGELKKRARNTKSAQSSIVPLEQDALAAFMSFPPRFGIFSFSHGYFTLFMDSKYQLICHRSRNLETSSKKRKSDDCTPEASKR
jgi:hypothetical protein